ncbi:hypothetical protein M3J09_010398 [Ascochyta lentis]
MMFLEICHPSWPRCCSPRRAPCDAARLLVATWLDTSLATACFLQHVDKVDGPVPTVYRKHCTHPPGLGDCFCFCPFP